VELRSRIGVFVAATFLLLAPGSALAAKKVRVGFLSDGPTDGALVQVHVDAIREVTAGDSTLEVELPPTLQKSADGSLAGVRRALDELLADTTVDLVITLGPVGSQVAVRRAALPKPVIAARVLDPKLGNVPQAPPGPPGAGSGSGIKNLVYVSDGGAIGRDLAALRGLGDVRRVSILVARGLLESVDNLSDGLRDRAREASLEATIAAADPAFITDADAAYLLGTDGLPAASVSALVTALHARKIRTLSARGNLDVQAGVLAGLTSPDDQRQRARRVAVLVTRLASGEAAATIATQYQRPESFYLNLSTAQSIGWTPSFIILTDAEIIGAAGPDASARALTLSQAITEALRDNRDFLANRQEIEAASEDIAQAIANFLPKAELQLRGVMIDSERAAASFGTQAQRSLSGVAQLRGVLYSDKVFANHTIQHELDDARHLLRGSLELDLTLETARAYVAVLQTRVLESVRLENVRKTRANLAQARLRQSVGSAGPTEVLRWESQIALDRREVLRARSLRRQAETQLNRLCHRPLDERMAPQAESADTGLSLLTAEQLDKVIQNEGHYARFVDFMVREGLAQSPEVKALEHAVAAADRATSAAVRAFFVPSLGYQVELAYRLAKGGEGVEPPQLPAMLPPEQAAILGAIVPPPIGDFTFQVAGVLSLPLPLDTAMFSELRRAEAELGRRQTELQSAQEKVEQRIRSAALRVGASHPSVALAQASAESARKGLAIAQDAYAGGAIGVLDLLDAQNVALVAELLAVNARYEFISDELDLERSLGSFLFLKTKEERDAWMRRSIESVTSH
jgi:outer membrane protein TolC